ncbi:MAG: hypothetical protein HQ559_05840, partial [Lentisphaerae bacterium]|nr:hypothetical protein [Lentisphaerota bacterium]
MKRAAAFLVFAAVVMAGCEPSSPGTGEGALPRPGTDAFEVAMDNATGTTLRPGQIIKVLSDGKEAFPAMLDAIRGAQTRVSFETYILAPDLTGRAFLQAFAEAAQRGVTVRMLVDAFGSLHLEDEHFTALQEAGVEVRVFNP